MNPSSTNRVSIYTSILHYADVNRDMHPRNFISGSCLDTDDHSDFVTIYARLSDGGAGTNGIADCIRGVKCA
jgi:hypothetical protein